MLSLTRTSDFPAAYYEEMMDSPAPRGVHVIHDKQGRVVDVKLDPVEFDGPDGVPEGWSRTMDTTMNRAWHGVLGYLFFLAFLAALCLGSLAGLTYLVTRLF